MLKHPRRAGALHLPLRYLKNGTFFCTFFCSKKQEFTKIPFVKENSSNLLWSIDDDDGIISTKHLEYFLPISHE